MTTLVLWLAAIVVGCILGLVWGILRGAGDMARMDEEMEAHARYREWKAEQAQRQQQALEQLREEFRQRVKERRVSTHE